MDHVVAAAPDQRKLMQIAKGKHNFSYYFNNGVLVYDLEKWRSTGVTRRLENRLRSVSTKGDIGIENLAMNFELADTTHRLDFRWNVLGLGWYPFRIPSRCLDQARILHWNGQWKPWSCTEQLRGLHD